MERLQCKACGSFSMVPMEIEIEDENQPSFGGEQETRFYTCHVCGDNWLSVKETDMKGECQLTFIHQMGTEPIMKRVAHMATSIVLKDDTVDQWEYFLGEDEVKPDEWKEKLASRRKVLKSVCSN